MQLMIPEQILVRSEFMKPNETMLLREVLEKACMGGRTYDHQGTRNVNYEQISHDEPKCAHMMDKIHGYLKNLSLQLMQVEGEAYINYSDLTYRPAFTPMGMHNDIDWYPERLTTAVISLGSCTNTHDRSGGRSIVEIEGVEQKIPAVEGQLLLFPSKFMHAVEAAWEPRAIFIVWTTLDPDKQQKGLPLLSSLPID